MERDTFLILGGYGSAGRLIARLLLRETDSHVVLAGRELARAEALARALASEHGERVSATRVDAADPSSLRRAMEGCRMVVVASSTTEYAGQVARAALDAGIDYLDVQYSSAKLEALRALEEEIRQAGRCFITDGGFHPGLPAVLVRYAASRFDRLLRAEVGSLIRIDWAHLDVGVATMEELVRESLGTWPLEFREGAWRPMRWTASWRPRTMDFGPEFGRQACVPMFLEELRAMPELYPGLKRVGFYVGGFNGFVNWVVMPVAWLAMRLWPRRALGPMARLLHWGLRRFSRPPHGTLLKLEADGLERGLVRHLELTLSHADGYWFTAIPVVACLLQYLDGTARRPGLWLQAQLPEPERMLRDMERMGVALTRVESAPNRESASVDAWGQTPVHP